MGAGDADPAAPRHLRNGHGGGGGCRREAADAGGGGTPAQHRLRLLPRLAAHLQEGTYAVRLSSPLPPRAFLRTPAFRLLGSLRRVSSLGTWEFRVEKTSNSALLLDAPENKRACVDCGMPTIVNYVF